MLAPTPGRTFSEVTSHHHAEDAHLRATGLKGLPGKISGAPTGRRQRWDWLARVDVSRNDSTYLMEVLLRSKSILWPNGSPLVYSTKYKGKLCLFEGTISTTRVRSWLLQIRPCSCWKSQAALSLLKGDIQLPSVVRNSECLSPASLPDPSAPPCLSDPTSQSPKPSLFPEHMVPSLFQTLHLQPSWVWDALPRFTHNWLSSYDQEFGSHTPSLNRPSCPPLGTCGG